MSACAGEGQPAGPTSVFLTIRSQSSIVPEELRLSARTIDMSVFEAQRLPETGTLVPVGGSLLGTVTLYVGNITGLLQIEVVGQVRGVPRLRGITTVDIADDHQVTALITLDTEIPQDAGGLGDGPVVDAGGGTDTTGADTGGMPDAGVDAAMDEKPPVPDVAADVADDDAGEADTAVDMAVDAHDGGGNTDVPKADATSPDATPDTTAPPDATGSDAKPTDGGMADATTLTPFLRLRFDETAGTVAEDSSPNNRDGMFFGGVTHVAVGRLGGAVHLDGVSGTYIALPANLLDTVGDVTITTWVRVATAKNFAKVFDFGGGAGLRTMYLATQQTGGPMRFAITTSGLTGEQVVDAPAALAVGVWTHVAVVLGASGGTLYVDGAMAATSATVTMRPRDLATTPNVWLGRSQNAATPVLDGDLDDFRIYDRALTAAEVAQVYGATQ